MSGELSVAEIRKWESDDVTVEVFDRIRQKIRVYDETIYLNLLNGNPQEAERLAYATQELKELLEIADDLKDEIKEN